MQKVPPLLPNKITIVVSKQNVIYWFFAPLKGQVLAGYQGKPQVINQVIDHHLPAVY
jgi:hypothetical protein